MVLCLHFLFFIDASIPCSCPSFVYVNDCNVSCINQREVYDKLSPGYNGRCTAPLLVDLKGRKIVSNDSSDIIRMLNKVNLGEETTVDCIDLYPRELASKIDETNKWVYEYLNNGVYRCGFSTRQDAYDKASNDVRKGLELADKILEEQDFLCGNVFTEADLRLLPTILRFDGAYSPLFRAGGVNRRIRDYPNLLAWLQRCWKIEGVEQSIDLQDAVASYYKQLFPLNPGGLLPTPISKEEIGLVQRYLT
jgi:putative glutathione S-transferase